MIKHRYLFGAHIQSKNNAVTHACKQISCVQDPLFLCFLLGPLALHGIHVVIKPEFSKFPKKIKVWSLSSYRCKFSVSVDFVS